MTSPVGGSGRRGVQSVTGRVSGSSTEDGARAFYEVSRRLKEVGGSGKGSLRNEMMKAVKQAAKPIPAAVAAEAGKRFPARGGLAKIMGKRKPTVTTRTGAATAGVQIRDRKTDPRMNAQGRIYHPVFGRPGADVAQIVPGVRGYFDDAAEGEAAGVRQEVTDVLADFMNRIPKGM